MAIIIIIDSALPPTTGDRNYGPVIQIEKASSDIPEMENAAYPTDGSEASGGRCGHEMIYD